MDINAILAQLGGELNLPELKLNEDNALRLTFDRVLHVDLDYDPADKQAHLHAVVAAVPVEGTKKILLTLLEANLFGQGTDGAVFGVDSLQRDILLCRSLAMEQTDYTEFTKVLESFVHVLEQWRTKLAEAPPAPDLGPDLAGAVRA